MMRVSEVASALHNCSNAATFYMLCMNLYNAVNINVISITDILYYNNASVIKGLCAISLLYSGYMLSVVMN